MGNHAKDHFLDVDFETARSLHRVVRAMHDGECPKCHAIHPSKAMESLRVANGKSLNAPDVEIVMDHRCPTCGFVITNEEGHAALAAFAPVMEKNLEVFERWRANRKDHQ